MFSITIKLMRKSARMLIPAGIAILIGTAFIAATFLFSNSMSDLLRSQMTASYADATHVVSRDSSVVTNDDAAPETPTVATFRLDRIRAVHGVRGVRADTTASITISADGRSVTGIAVGTSPDRSLLPVTISQGEQPSGDDRIALPQSVANGLDLKIGDKVRVTSEQQNTNGETVNRSADVTVSGITDDPKGAFSFYGGGSVLSDNVIAQMNGVADFSHVVAPMLLLDIDGGDTAAASQTVDEVRGLLPSGYTIDTRTAIGDRLIANLGADQSTSITTTFLLSFGVLALFVAALVIANTFQVLVAQRRRTLALLRTIGAKKGQLYASVVAEAMLLGMISSVLGVAVGIGLMAAVIHGGMMRMLGGTVANLILTWPVFVVPIAFGVIMTVLASLSSARTATSVTPLEALRPIELVDAERHAGKGRAVIGTFMLVIGLVAAGFAVWRLHGLIASGAIAETGGYPSPLLLAIAGAAAIFLGLMVTATFWMPLLMRGIGALVARIGPSATIANSNIQKNPRRVAATGTALLIGVTLVSTIATGAASGKQTMGESLANRYSVDMAVTGEKLSDKNIAQAAKIRGVESTLYVPTAIATIDDPKGDQMSVLLIGVRDVSQLKGVMRADLDGVTLGNDEMLIQTYRGGDGERLVYGGKRLKISEFEGYAGMPSDAAGTADAEGAAGDAGNDQSDTSVGRIRAGFELTPVNADFRNVSDDQSAVAFVSDTHFTNGDITASGHMLLMRVDVDKAGTTLSDVFEQMQNTFSYDTGAVVTGPVVERAVWENIIDSMLKLLIGLIAVAVLIALIGVANTLSLSVIERTRESATLRAIGMTRGQLRRSLAVEALMLSLVAGVAGIVLGTLFGWLGSYMVFSLYGEVAFPIDWTINGIVLAVAAVAALVASVAPARRAVGVPPVEALAEA